MIRGGDGRVTRGRGGAKRCPLEDREQRWAGWMRAANRGDDAAYRALLGEMAGVLRAVAARRLGGLGLDAHEAEDVVQEALIGIHQKRATWDETRPILPWVHAVARYKMLDSARRQGRSRRGRVDAPAEDFAEIVAAPEPAAPPGAADDAAKLLSALPDGQRRVVEAVAVEGLSHREAGEKLGMNEGAVRVALHRGLKRLEQLGSAGERDR
jgi:RNA polymerase sigma-70 factor (ECF subfamily)